MIRHNLASGDSSARSTARPYSLRHQQVMGAILVATVGIGAASCSNGGQTTASAIADRSETTEVVPVTRTDVSETKRVNASVGHGTVRKLPILPGRMITWAPEQDTVLAPGDVAIMLDDKPVVLARGKIPGYRELRQIPFFQTDRAGNPVGLQTGPDVEQLQAFLIDLGFDDDGQLAGEQGFGPSTDRAARAWQASVGHPPDGIINDTHLVFIPGNIRVASTLEVGDRFAELSFTSTDVILTINAPTTARPFFTVGQVVDVEVGDSLVNGTVTKSTRIFEAETNSARQIILVTVPGLGTDDLGESVDVVGTVVQADDVLTVPVRALLAFTDGAWGVEVADGSGETEWVAIDLVSVIDTTAVIDGIDEGTEVVIPL